MGLVCLDPGSWRFGVGLAIDLLMHYLFGIEEGDDSALVWLNESGQERRRGDGMMLMIHSYGIMQLDEICYE